MSVPPSPDQPESHADDDRSGAINQAGDLDIHLAPQVVVDGDLSEAKLRTLIARNGEEDVLDYKRSYDLAGSKATKDKLEAARDIVAMANTRGGYIVIGIDEDMANPQQ